MVDDDASVGHTHSADCRLTVIDSIRNDLVISIAEFFPDDYISYYLNEEQESEIHTNVKLKNHYIELKSKKIRHILSVLKQHGYTLTPLFNWDKPPEEMVESLCMILAREVHTHWFFSFKENRSNEITDVRQCWDKLDDHEKEKILEEVRTYPSIFAISYLVMEGDAREILAQKIHENYLEIIKKNNLDSPTAVKWAELSEEYRDSNRNDIQLLRNCGFRISPISKHTVKPISFSLHEITKIAKIEHQRWVQEKQRNGWKWGSERDEGKKIHPDLVPWDSLSGEEKEKNLDIVRNIIKLIEEVGHEIIREGPSDEIKYCDQSKLAR
jgi:hypothetical protein